MTAQLSLCYIAPPAPKEPRRLYAVDSMPTRKLNQRSRDEWERRAREFHERHPEVFESFERIALDTVAASEARGWSPKLSAKLIWELVRRDLKITLANSYTRTYALLFIECHPEHASKFRGAK